MDLETLKKNPTQIFFIETALITPELLNSLASEFTGENNIHYFITRFSDLLYPESWEKLLVGCPEGINMLPKEYKNIDLYTRLVRKNYKIYELMADDLKTEEQTLDYLDNRSIHSKHIPVRLLTDAVVNKIFNGFVNRGLTIHLDHIPYMPVEILLKLAATHAYFVPVVNPNYTTYEDWIRYAKSGFAVWEKIPKEYRTNEMVIAYCSFLSISVNRVELVMSSNPDLMTLELAFDLVRYKALAYPYLPQKIKEASYELAVLYASRIRHNCWRKDFPLEFLTHEIKMLCFFDDE